MLLTGCLPLQRAAGRGDTAQVQQLLDQGIDVNARDGNNNTALICAAGSGNTETVDLLLKRGADVNAIDDGGWTALIRAAFRGHAECVKLLLAHGANVNQTRSAGPFMSSCTAAGWAKKGGYPEVAQIIEAASQKGTTKEVAQPSVPTTLTPPAESATPF